jgi:hypothetical protein
MTGTLSLFTVFIADHAAAAYNADDLQDATQLIQRLDFEQHLQTRRTGSIPLWDGAALIEARPAAPSEEARWIAYEHEARAQGQGTTQNGHFFVYRQPSGNPPTRCGSIIRP